MSFIEELRKEKIDDAKFLSKPEYSGIRNLVEKLYPDKAHFIFELLQNAEDVGATEAKFILHEDSLTFEHNGHDFTQENVRGITNIAKGSKSEQGEEMIGQFGIGFKAVFAYTDTPHIWSPSYSFSISEWIVPNPLPADASIGQKTRFRFPFDKPKKPRQNAYNEILAGLTALSENTLLFLSHIEFISWQIDKGEPRELWRYQRKRLNFDRLDAARLSDM